MKVLVALRVPGTDVRDVIQVHRRYLVQLMQQWTRIKESEAESDMNLALVVDAELFRLDAVVRWLDAADGRIKRAAADASDEKGTAASDPKDTADAPAAASTAGPPPPSLPKRRRRAGAGR
jgi:hypothetical protein